MINAILKDSTGKEIQARERERERGTWKDK